MNTLREKRPVQITDLFRLKILQEARFSPDGNTIVYCVSQIDAEKEEEYATLWIHSLETGISRQLTAGLTRDSGPAWSPDGKQIAFLSNRGDKPQIYIIPVDGGEARSLTAMKQGVGSPPVWSPDGKWIAYTAGPGIDPPNPMKPYRITRTIYRFDGVGLVDRCKQDIYVCPVDGGEPRQLTYDDCMNNNPLWSPDGKEILYSSSFSPDSYSAYGSLNVVNLKGEIREIAKDIGIGQTYNWTPDGKFVVFTGNNGKPYLTKYDLWIVNRGGSAMECRTKNLEVGVRGILQGDFPVNWYNQDGPIAVDMDSTSAYVHIQEGGNKNIYRIALTGPEAWTPITKGDQACALMDKNGSQLLYAVSTINNPADLFITDLNGINETQITHLNDEMTDEWQLPTTERLTFQGADGERVEGWIMKPAFGEDPYPTILYIHGGPYVGFGNIFCFDFQMLAGAGYAVLFINHRGSSGYGNNFSTVIRGNFGELSYQDLMAGVDFAIAKGITDHDRLGVCGLSGGGYLTCWIVGQTDRFKAAVPENMVTNFVSFYGVSDIGPVVSDYFLGGSPHEIPDIYQRCSPITFAHKCKTPTLLIQGELDLRCAAEQSEQFYTVLRVNGCIAEMLRLPGCSHEGTIIGPPIYRRVQNEALLEWMNRYVMGIASK
jgi:dipeptidyl aminopeptidase/acylaminoacyl peptidase